MSARKLVVGRSILMAAAVAILAVAPAFAGDPAGPKCTPQNIIIEYPEWQETYVPDYPFCVTIPVRGTLNGTAFSCAVWDEQGIDGMSLFPLGPDPDFYSGYYHEWIETKDGRLSFYTVVAGQWSTFLGASLSKIVPERSTGEFAGATGILSNIPEWQTYDPTVPGPFNGNLRLEGYVCTP